MNIGIFGGSFDPPHMGHLHAAKSFIREASLSLLYIIPTYVSPFKKDKDGVALDKDRLEMCRLCFSQLETEQTKVIISDIETNRKGTSYTIDTIDYLRSCHESDNLFLYVGTDTFITLDKWKNYFEIFKNCTIYTHVRNNDESLQISDFANNYKAKFNARILISKDSPFVCSSTCLRENIKQNNFINIKKLLTENVLGYIIKNDLYRRENDE